MTLMVILLAVATVISVVATEHHNRRYLPRHSGEWKRKSTRRTNYEGARRG